MNKGLNEELVGKIISYEGKVLGEDFTIKDLNRDFAIFDKIIVAEQGQIFTDIKSDRLIFRINENNRVLTVIPR